ncbi:hypothetical protein J6590_054981 [Homalodisca vitripennis]|nr:hypothetical protein J6590_054981 [Homalodisca vitripennis]
MLRLLVLVQPRLLCWCTTPRVARVPAADKYAPREPPPTSIHRNPLTTSVSHVASPRRCHGRIAGGDVYGSVLVPPALSCSSSINKPFIENVPPLSHAQSVYIV